MAIHSISVLVKDSSQMILFVFYLTNEMEVVKDVLYNFHLKPVEHLQ